MEKQDLNIIDEAFNLGKATALKLDEEQKSLSDKILSLPNFEDIQEEVAYSYACGLMHSKVFKVLTQYIYNYCKEKSNGEAE